MRGDLPSDGQRAGPPQAGPSGGASNPGPTGAEPDKAMDASWTRLTVAGNTDAVRRALLHLLQGPPFAGLSPGLRSDAEIVLAEVLNNIVEHAYAASAGNIEIRVRRQVGGLACQIRDHGAPMPGLSLPDGAFQPLGAIADLPEGGFGWFLIRNTVEDLQYRREGGANRLSFLLPYEQSKS